MKWKNARKSHPEQESSSVPKVKTVSQTDVKRLNSLMASPMTRGQQFLVYCGQDEKDRRVIIDIIPCVVVTSLETDAFMAIVAYFDMLTVKGNPARVRKEEGTQGSVAILTEKSPKLCISRLRSNEFYSSES